MVQIPSPQPTSEQALRLLRFLFSFRALLPLLLLFLSQALRWFAIGFFSRSEAFGSVSPRTPTTLRTNFRPQRFSFFQVKFACRPVVSITGASRACGWIFSKSETAVPLRSVPRRPEPSALFRNPRGRGALAGKHFLDNEAVSHVQDGTVRTTLPTFSPRCRMACAASASVMGSTR